RVAVVHLAVADHAGPPHGRARTGGRAEDLQQAPAVPAAPRLEPRHVLGRVHLGDVGPQIARAGARRPAGDHIAALLWGGRVLHRGAVLGERGLQAAPGRRPDAVQAGELRPVAAGQVADEVQALRGQRADRRAAHAGHVRDRCGRSVHDERLGELGRTRAETPFQQDGNVGSWGRRGLGGRWGRRRPPPWRDGDPMTLRTDALTASILYDGSARSLRLDAATAEALTAFEGTSGPSGDGYVLTGELSTANAIALQAAIPCLRPRRISDHRTSVGTGDRTGLATPGQARAFAAEAPAVMP